MHVFGQIWTELTRENSGICLKVIFCLWGIPQVFSQHIHICRCVDIACFQKVSVHQQINLRVQNSKRSADLSERRACESTAHHPIQLPINIQQSAIHQPTASKPPGLQASKPPSLQAFNMPRRVTRSANN